MKTKTKGVAMTMPDERTRALRWAGEFLLKVQRDDEFSEAIKRVAKVILRHYPRDFEIKLQAELDARRSKTLMEQWLGPEDRKRKYLVSRVFYNYVAEEGDKKTPAMRLGLAEKKVSLDEIIEFSPI